MRDDIITDLAYETLSYAPTELKGVKSRTENMEHGVKIHTVEILDQQGEKEIGKPRGLYVTVEAKSLVDREPDVEKYVALVLSGRLKNMTERLVKFDKSRPTLVVGIGNPTMTADALGSRTCEGMIVTRHVYETAAIELDSRLASVCAISPNVLGVTGIETFDIVSGLVEKIKPQLVMIVDSLASQKTERISTTFQLTDTGIVPGGGIGNARRELSEKTLGVPVIAVGVPLVVYAKTIVGDVLEQLDMEGKRPLANLVMTDILGDLVVTPKDIDKLVEDSSFIVSTALNLSLHRDLTVDDVMDYVH